MNVYFNRRRNLVQVIGFTTAAKQLIVTARNINKPRMQTLVELVERLYDDLNLPQLIREARKKQMATPIVDGKLCKDIQIENKRFCDRFSSSLAALFVL